MWIHRLLESFITNYNFNCAHFNWNELSVIWSSVPDGSDIQFNNINLDGCGNQFNVNYSNGTPGDYAGHLVVGACGDFLTPISFTILDDSYVTVETLNLAWEGALNNGSACNMSGSDRAMLPPEYQDCNLHLHPGAGLSVLLTQTPENHSGWVNANVDGCMGELKVDGTTSPWDNTPVRWSSKAAQRSTSLLRLKSPAEKALNSTFLKATHGSTGEEALLANSTARNSWCCPRA